ncbi:putative bifunctional diguanylate cyclase/phosphodiesterase [Massilia sp. S19_KUP03_FR1]|uniref:putative bifunctional diguanylate cyclase/phosphodiesterase n=1 Tax=Massilia sp. S19_KUP03_FR1 TaxID=3025503 RepID=UPI002FCDBA5B
MFPPEAARLDALRRLDLLDAASCDAFDRITRMAAQLFNVPMAAISLTDTDRQWFKSRVGVQHCQRARVGAPCATVTETGGMLVVPDLRADAVHKHSYLVQEGVRFYAGAPLTTRDGFTLGALCVLGHAARVVTVQEERALRDLAAMVMAQIELQHALGRIDPLSGLPNRQQFIDDLRDLAMDRAPGEARLGVLVNLATPAQLADAMHAMSSSCLDDIVGEGVRMLRASVGSDSTVYHLTTTQFAFIAPPDAALTAFAEMLAAWLDERNHSVNSRYVTTATVGIAPFQVGACSALDLMRNMHSAAHDAQDSESRVGIFSAAQDAVYRRRFALANDFGAALEQPGQLRLVFQPKVDLASGACIGAEALLRWAHPVLGEVSPAEFIPIVERTAMARAATAWVLEAAMTQLAAWQAAGLVLQLAVNVSPANLLEPDFAARVAAGLARHGLPAANLSLEITESALMSNPKAALATLERLNATGIHLAIDDFGTGYSSLSYLQRLPVNVVKIDQSFMRDLSVDPKRRALVAAMIKLSQNLGHTVVAEGVETEAVATWLRSVACDQAQGYLFARPMDPAAFAAWCTRYARPARPRLVCAAG